MAGDDGVVVDRFEHGERGGAAAFGAEGGAGGDVRCEEVTRRWRRTGVCVMSVWSVVWGDLFLIPES